MGVPWWLSRLRIWHCQCCGLGRCCGVGLIPIPGVSMCHRHGQKKKKKKKRIESCSVDDSQEELPYILVEGNELEMYKIGSL